MLKTLFCKFPLLLLVALCCSAMALEPTGEEPVSAAEGVNRDSVEVEVSSVGFVDDALSLQPAQRKSSTRWIRQLIENRFQIHDSTIYYPAVPRFALNVYNWGDRTFNSYDTTYVVGTGTNWKLQGKTFAWIESQNMFFPKNTRLQMHSNLFMDAGAYLSFMAVSVGYMWNIDGLFDHNTKRHTFNFDFSCSRFSINYSKLSSDGGMILTHMGDYNGGHNFRFHFDNVKINSANTDAYYFFNHRKYSHSAAYSFSKYQKRTAGTAIAGINYSEQSINMDFSALPSDMIAYLPLDNPKFNLHYRDLAALGGYGRTWVFPKKGWILNLTSLLALGFKRTSEDATDGKRLLIANNYKISLSAVYNYRRLFASFQTRFNGQLYYNSSFIHFSTLNSFTLNVGMRF